MNEAAKLRESVKRFLSNADAFFKEKRSNSSSTQGMPMDELLSGIVNLTDAKLATRFVHLLRDKNFANAVDAGIKDISKIGTAFSLRLEKKIMELKEFAKEASSRDQVPAALRTFLQKQEHITKSSLEQMAKPLERIIMALPKEYHPFAGVSKQVLNRMAAAAVSRLSQGHMRIFGQDGADVCGNYRRLLSQAQRVFPLLSQAVAGLPQMETVASSQAPDLVPVAKKTVSKLSSFAKTFGHRLDQDAKFLIDTICELAPAAAAPVV